MKKSYKGWITVLGFAGAVFLSACNSTSTQVKEISIIPLPNSIVETSSAFVLPEKCTIGVTDKSLIPAADYLVSILSKSTGYQFSVTEGKGDINLSLADSGKEGSYSFVSTKNSVSISGSSYAGVIYGIETLRQLLPSGIESKEVISNMEWAIPAVEIKDSPRFGWRGLMLDVSRHFYDKDEVKELLDLMALYKMNKFHWHLTDDQGWRVEIKKYPLLTEKGAWRKYNSHDKTCLELAKKNDNTDYLIPEEKIRVVEGDTLYGGFYTQDDIKEIVSYAQVRGIDVIPEIDMPGHMLAALASYPELGCTGGPYETATKFGVFKEVLCGGNPQTLQFAKDVVNELMDIFPDAPYIHIGGDECPKAEWKKCPKCQAKIKELGLRDTKEHSKENQLQVYFMNEVEKEIAKRGKKMLAWDEILEGNPNPETTTVMAWTGIKASIKAAQLGHPTIVCPISHLYFSNPGYNRLKGVSSVERVYSFEPQSEKLTPEEKKNIIGVQGCIWTEWTKDSVKMEWQMMPRIAALSELQWSNPAKKDLNGFLKRLRHQLDLYELYGFHYKMDIEDVTIDVEPKGEGGTAVITLNTFDNAPVYYTLDGSEPSAASQQYTQPFTVDKTTTIKAKAIRNGRESNVTEETLTYNLATMHPITLKCEPDEKFTYKGANLLVDGMTGDDNYRSGRYIGIYGQDFDATIDLQEPKEISSVSLGTYLVPGDYIFGLTGLEVYGSEDGKTYSKIASKAIPTLEKGSKNNVLKRDTVNFDKTKTRYVQIIGKNTPVLPKWHPGAGKQTYLFLDEIAVN